MNPEETAAQLAALQAELAAGMPAYDPSTDSGYDARTAAVMDGHRRTDTDSVRASYAQLRAECACGWAGEWRPYFRPLDIEADWLEHLEGSA